MNHEHTRRSLLRGLAATGTVGWATTGSVGGTPAEAPNTDPHTRETFSALLEAIIPETPELAEELGPEYEPGAVSVGLDEFFVTFLNELVAVGLPGFGHLDNARLSEGVAAALDAAAAELLARGENEHPPTAESGAAGGPFARLSPRDRMRAISLFEEKEGDTGDLPGPFAESDGGLIAQLMNGFAPFVYYSDWAGYDDYMAPRSEREFDPDDIVAWDQVEYPGIEDGYAALRGYLRLDAEADGVQLRMSPGSFEENDYDTSDYEDPYPESSDEESSSVSLDSDVTVDPRFPDGLLDPSPGGGFDA